MKLYNLETCFYCAIVRNKLAELGLSYENIEVPLFRPERKEVFDVSGQYTVPVLIDGDHVFDDENDIIAYLEEKYGKTSKKE